MAFELKRSQTRSHVGSSKSYLTIPCRICGAGKGKPCKGKNSQTLVDVHRLRATDYGVRKSNNRTSI